MKKSFKLSEEAFQMDGKMPLSQAIPLGLQHVLAMFVGNLTPLLIITGACGLAGGEFAQLPHPLTVIVNHSSITMRGKAQYVFVDVFDYIDFDLGTSASAGRSIVTNINGRPAQYMEPLSEGDVIEIYWKNMR